MALCNITQSISQVKHGGDLSQRQQSADDLFDWAEAHVQIARMTLTIKLDRSWNSFQLTNGAPPPTVTDSAIAPSARMPVNCEAILHAYAQKLTFHKPRMESCLLGVHDLELSWTSIVRGDRLGCSGNW